MADKHKKGKEPAPQRLEERRSEPLPSARVAAGKTCLRSLGTLLDDLNHDRAATYVAVRQQDGLSPAKVIQALSRISSRRIEITEDGQQVQGATVYVGPGSELLTNKDGLRARLREIESTNQELRLLIAELQATKVELEHQVRAALQQGEKRLRSLLAELQHRVRNTLAVAKCITQRTAESSESVDDMAAHLHGRFDAFARVQSAEARNPGAGIALGSMVRDELLAHAAHEGENIVITGEDVALHLTAAESISLALHELATNAVKHGALARKGGRIVIRWSMNGDGDKKRLDFEWCEDGVDGVNRNPERSGFGMELLTRVLTYDLLAQTNVEFLERGFRFEMRVPAKRLTHTA